MNNSDKIDPEFFTQSREEGNNDLNLPILYTVLEVCVAVSAVFGNLLVIIMFIQDRRLRKVTNFYIISLSIADFLVGAIGIPSAILTRLGMPRNSIRVCITMLSLLVVLCTISILNLVAVSLDRYWAILYPLDYHKRISEKTALVIICICWILGLLIGFLPLFGWNNGHLAKEACYFIPIMNYNFLMFLYFATIVFPAIIMAFFYIRIYIVVVQQLSLNKVRQLSTSEFSLSKMKSSKQSLGSNGNVNLADKNKEGLKLSSVNNTPTTICRFKNSNSSFSHQLNEIGREFNGHAKASSVNQFAADNCLVDEICSNSCHSSVCSRQTNNFPEKSTRMNHSHLMERSEKDRKWMSLLNMRHLGDSYLSGSDTEGKLQKNGSTTSSVINSFYRNSSNIKLSYSRREVKKAQKLFVIVVFFMLCWIPLYTSNTIMAFCPHCPSPSSNLLDFLIILSHINSAGSPFLYAFHMKDFRETFRRLVCKGAINKRQLRELRREELFNGNSRQGNQSQLTNKPKESKNMSQNQLRPTVSDYYLYRKPHRNSRNIHKTIDHFKNNKTYKAKQNSCRDDQKHCNCEMKNSTKQYSDVPKCGIQIELEETEARDCFPN